MLEPRDRLIFALDYPTLEQARAGAALVAPSAGMLKVGLELFVRYGPGACAIAGDRGAELFLDLKLCDIPETVGRAVASAATLGARYLTVHASGGRRMIERAVAAAERARAHGEKLEIVAVTALTSLADADVRDLGVARTAEEHAVALAELAFSAGARAFVCAPAEAALVRERLFALGGAAVAIITPGIRPAGLPAGDQKRSATVAEAIAAGADRLVVGRPIRDAADPAQAARDIVDQIARAARAS